MEQLTTSLLTLKKNQINKLYNTKQSKIVASSFQGLNSKVLVYLFGRV